MGDSPFIHPYFERKHKTQHWMADSPFINPYF